MPPFPHAVPLCWHAGTSGEGTVSSMLKMKPEPCLREVGLRLVKLEDKTTARWAGEIERSEHKKGKRRRNRGGGKRERRKTGHVGGKEDGDRREKEGSPRSAFTPGDPGRAGLLSVSLAWSCTFPAPRWSRAEGMRASLRAAVPTRGLASAFAWTLTHYQSHILLCCLMPSNIFRATSALEFLEGVLFLLRVPWGLVGIWWIYRSCGWLRDSWCGYLAKYKLLSWKAIG